MTLNYNCKFLTNIRFEFYSFPLNATPGEVFGFTVAQ